MPRYKLTIAYRGTAYHGWQEQDRADLPAGHLPTVQRLVRLAARDVVGHPVTLTGSSRTDAGVHAKGQVASFTTDQAQIPPEGLRRAMNSRLPADVLVRDLHAVRADFDPIGDTLEKRYQYHVHCAPDRPVFGADLTFHRRWDLDPAAMNRAAAHLIGGHDCASFAKPGHGRETTVRTITDCRVARRGRSVVIGVAGTGFLWNQVRIVAGTLIDVGRGATDPDAIPGILAARDRTAAGPTAPAHGLFLQWIRHGGPADR